ncbi:MAG: hypothetical protein ACT4PV_11205 [Planctomycetaceae bacterium]
MPRLALLLVSSAVLCAAVEPEPASYYLRELRPFGLEVDGVTPLILSPLAQEKIPITCPERLVVCTSPVGGRGRVVPFLKALGEVTFPKGAPEGLVQSVEAKIERIWRAIEAGATRELAGPPVRVFFKHYPREPSEMGGARAITLHATLYSVPDLFLDMGSTAISHDLAELARAPAVPGLILDIRKTWRITPQGPRLIEASIEVTEDVHNALRGPGLCQLLQDPSVSAVAADAGAIMHFELYHGERWGMLWIDRAVTGPVDGWARAYHIPYDADRTSSLETEPLPAPVVARLLELVGRA